MKGTSTKLSASGFALAVQGVLFWVLFEATWGPLWAAPPTEVALWVAGIVATILGWLVPEKAFAPAPDPEPGL